METQLLIAAPTAWCFLHLMKPPAFFTSKQRMFLVLILEKMRDSGFYIGTITESATTTSDYLFGFKSSFSRSSRIQAAVEVSAAHDFGLTMCTRRRLSFIAADLTGERLRFSSRRLTLSITDNCNSMTPDISRKARGMETSPAVPKEAVQVYTYWTFYCNVQPHVLLRPPLKHSQCGMSARGRGGVVTVMTTSCETWFWCDSTVWNRIVDLVHWRRRHLAVSYANACDRREAAWRVVFMMVGWRGGVCDSAAVHEDHWRLLPSPIHFDHRWVARAHATAEPAAGFTDLLSCHMCSPRLTPSAQRCPFWDPVCFIMHKTTHLPDWPCERACVCLCLWAGAQQGRGKGWVGLELRFTYSGLLMSVCFIPSFLYYYH